MSRLFQLIVLTPTGLCDPALAIAASRAGELGILDLEHYPSVEHPNGGVPEVVRRALASLALHARAPFGIKLSAADAALRQALLKDAPDGLSVVVIAGVPTDDLRTAIDDWHRLNVTVLCEVTDAGAAAVAVEAGADGLVAKGHEAGGRIGEESTFVLLQRLRNSLDTPIYAQGGIGLHTAAACFAAGAAGVVLNAQLALTRESTLPDAVKDKIAAMDGSETVALGARLGTMYRFYSRQGLAALDALRREEARLEMLQAGTADNTASAGDPASEWRAAVESHVGWGTPAQDVYPLGQDAAFASWLADRYSTVAGILAAIRTAIAEHVAAAHELHPLDEGSPLAHAHGTRYPIVQGPMTRVSDTAAFAHAVAEGGGLPLLALALLRANEVRALLEETRALLGPLPWGVGILGFVSAELRQEQIEVIREIRPPFALIAGGRPDQAASMEREGIPTYLHVPSPGLLSMFLADGAHRFVFEGRECGGHVGPRTSFVLWETMIEVLLQARRGAQDPPIDILFAGGIHDARSAAMVATMAAPLAQRGIRIGVLMGTAYLFTEEAVASGTIMPAFQQEALACTKTIVLDSGPGHSTRCVDTAFAAVFEAERRRLIADGLGTEEMRAALEDLNVGRLRIASKGITRNPRFGQDPDAPKFITLSEDDQRADGMYMIGQVAALRSGVTTVAALHAEVSVQGSRLLDELATTGEALPEESIHPAPADVAIIGIAALMPRAADAQAYWENILNKVDAIIEVPPDRWDWRRYFDEDKSARDRIYSRWGGFLDDVPFDPLSYGMPPNTLSSIEPMQLLVLEAVRAALDDAGYSRRPFARERTAVILGASGVSDLGLLYGVRSTLPGFVDGKGEDLLPELAEVLPEWTEDSFAGVLMNVTAGRVTNRFDFGGTNYTVDAACASSLAAISQAVKDLQIGNADVVIAGGADTTQNAHAFMSFSKTHALSAQGRCRPFDASADGIAISEGAAIVVLKRLADAERDGDRIYAVIKGVGASSDGRDKSLTAPRPEGQVRALERAYLQAGFSPATVGLFEAHGTGTVVGDKTEVASLSALLDASGAAPASAAIGSVKSMIGHTKASAGVAGLVKVALALYHKTLPPTLVETLNPNAGFGENALYVNTETRPWVDGSAGHPRRAGVSAFGFGGTNFHVALEEYGGDYLQPEPALRNWPSELFLFRAATRDALHQYVSAVSAGLERGAQPRLVDLSYSVYKTAEEVGADGLTLAVVATSLDDLRTKLTNALPILAGDAAAINEPRGVYFAAQPLKQGDTGVALLFPGQGSQYVNMLRDLTVIIHEVREAFEQGNAALAEHMPGGLGLASFIFPSPAFSEDEAARQQERLTATNVAQPALGAANLAMLTLLGQLGIAPDMVAGHSYGEFVALHAAGVYDAATMFLLSEARGRFMAEAAGSEDPGTMAAVSSDAATVGAAIAGIDGVVLANLNAPTQTVISGTTAGIQAAIERLKEAGLRAKRIPVSCAFHSPLVAGARDRLVDVLNTVEFSAPRLPVYSNMTAQAYPTDIAALVAQLGDHLVSPVRFVEEIEAMYEAGARIFVEVGPKNVLTGLADAILGAKPHLSVATDNAKRHGITQLQFALAQMAAQGVQMNLDRLYHGRSPRRLNPRMMNEQTGQKKLPPTTWLVNGGYVRPLPRSGNPEENRRLVAPVAQTVARGDTLLSSDAGVASPSHSGTTVPRANEEPLDTVYTTIGADNIVLSAMEEQMADIPKQLGVNGAGFEPITAPPAGNGTHPANGHTDGHASASAYNSVAGTNPAASMVPFNAPAEPWTAAPAPMPMYVDDLSAAMMQFQNVMAQFLETQRAVMGAYFGQPTPQVSAPGLSPTPAYVVPQPAYAPQAYAPAAAAPAYPQPVYMPPQPAYTPPQPAMPPQQHIPAAFPTAAPVSQPATPAHVAAAPASATPVAPAAAVPAAPAPATPAPEAPAAPVAQTPAATSQAAAAPAMSEAELTQRLLAIVAERTGYPTEMLDLDLDLEADLGIDSIKRVEIVGSLRRAVSTSGVPEGAMEKLSAVKTLRAVVTNMMEVLALAQAHPPPAGLTATVAAPDAPHSQVAAVPRFTLRATTAPSTPSHGTVSIPGTVVVTDDEQGIARTLAEGLRTQGHRVAVLRAALKTEEIGPDTFTANMAVQQEVGAALDLIRAHHGAIGGIVHLLPLRIRPSALTAIDLATWQERLAEEVKGLYHLARLTAAELGGDGKRRLPEGQKNGVLLAVTSMGGAFGFNTASLPQPVAQPGYFAGHGGIPGFLKTLGLEWPDTLVRALDVDSSASGDVLVQQILQELRLGDDEIEVGRQGTERVIVEPVAAPLETTVPPRLQLDSSSVILVTGGARGITAGVALELARYCRPTLLLAGRSQLPAPDEPADTADLTEARDIKAALIARMRAAGEQPHPARVETAFNRLMQDREMRAALVDLVESGATVRYYAVDVRDGTAFGALIDEIYATYGRLDGVIHGAGMIEDKLVRDKTPESFDRVFDTKTVSAYVLAQKLRSESLKFLAFFSSVTARFGNRGQADYGATNDTVNKLALELDARWPAHVISFNWGPWGAATPGSGMVAADIEAQFARRGVEMIAPAIGYQRAIEEILFGPKGAVEIVLGNGPWARGLRRMVVD